MQFFRLDVGRLRDRDLVRADRRLVLGTVAPVVPQVACNHLDHSGRGDGEERAEQAEQLHSDQDAHEHDELVDLDRPRHDLHLQHMVLELLVRDEEDQHRDAIRRRAQERHQDRWDRAERGADQGDEVGEADPEREHTAERHVEYQQRDEGRAACDDADQEVAEDVAGERAGAVMEHGLDAPSSWW